MNQPSLQNYMLCSRIEIGEDDQCWKWLGWYGNGYGKLDVVIDGSRRHRYAHRLLWELLRGSIPAGLEIDHNCQNTWCINPRHHNVVTHMDNMLNQRLSPYCKTGHEYEKVGYYTRYRRGAVERRCKECEKKWRRKTQESGLRVSQ